MRVGHGMPIVHVRHCSSVELKRLTTTRPSRIKTKSDNDLDLSSTQVDATSETSTGWTVSQSLLATHPLSSPRSPDGGPLTKKEPYCRNSNRQVQENKWCPHTNTSSTIRTEPGNASTRQKARREDQKITPRKVYVC